jgi:hypothetical protein
MPQFTLRRLLLVAPIFAVGLAVLIKGAYLETRNPRSNEEDDVAWAVLAVGASMIGAAIGLLFRFPATTTIALAILFPAVGFALLVYLYWACMIGYVIFIRFAGFG